MSKMGSIIILLSIQSAVLTLDKCKDWPKVIKGPNAVDVTIYALDASLEHDLIITGGISYDISFGT